MIRIPLTRSRRMVRMTARFVARLRGAALPGELAIFRSADLDGVPAPVARSLQAVLPEGQPFDFHSP